jgi:hypothetical protein
MLIGILLGLGIGLICIVVAILLLLRHFRKVWQIREPVFQRYNGLRDKGERVIAIVREIQEVPPPSPFDMPYMLFAEWQDPRTGQTHILKTPLRDPTHFPPGSSLVFLMDPDDFTNYFPAFLFDQKGTMKENF